MPKRNLHRQVKGLIQQKSDKLNLISGELGITINGQRTVEVSSRDGYVWVRLRGSQSELIQAYNASVSPIYDLPVLVIRTGNKYSIYGRDIERYDNWGVTPYLPKHGTQHSFAPELGMGGDVTWVYSRQFVPMLASPSGSSGAGGLVINPYVYRKPSDGSWAYVGDTGTDNALVAKPTDNQARMMLLYWDLDANDSAMLTGTLFSSSVTGTSAVLPYIPTTTDQNKIPLVGIRLVSGTTTLGWDNVYDVRQFAVNTPRPFEGGFFSVWDEGVPKGTGTILDFVGVNVDVSLSGTVARVFVTGSVGGGGGNPPITGSVIIQSEGETLGSVTKLNFIGDSVSVSVSGTVAQINEGNALFTSGRALGSIKTAEAGSSNYADGSYSFAIGQSNIVSGSASSILAGLGNHVRSDYAAVLAGGGNAVYGQYSSVLAGFGRTGTANNTAYTEYLNLWKLASGEPSQILGLAQDGSIVTGTAKAMPILDNGGYFTGSSSESAFQELGSRDIVFLTNSNEFYRGNNLTITSFSGTISGTPSGTSVVYTPLAGNESDLAQYDGLGALTSSNITKVVLFNITRGDYALISTVNLATNTIILTSSAPPGWANGDVITTLRPGGAFQLRACEIYDTSVIPQNATQLLLWIQISDSAGGNTAVWIAPDKNTPASSEIWVAAATPAANVSFTSFVTVPLYNRRILHNYRNAGGATGLLVVRIIGYVRG